MQRLYVGAAEKFRIDAKNLSICYPVFDSPLECSFQLVQTFLLCRRNISEFNPFTLAESLYCFSNFPSFLPSHNFPLAATRLNFLVFVLIANLEPILARIVAALERRVNGEWDGEVDEDCTIVPILDLHVSIFPADALNQF